MKLEQYHAATNIVFEINNIRTAIKHLSDTGSDVNIAIHPQGNYTINPEKIQELIGQDAYNEVAYITKHNLQSKLQVREQELIKELEKI